MSKFSPVFLLVAFSLVPPAFARTIDRTVALVNADVVLQSDVRDFKKNQAIRREIDPFAGLVGLPGDNTKEIIDYLVQERIILQKFPAQPEEIEEEINAVQRNNKIDRERLKEVLASQGVLFDLYQKLMAVSVSKRKLVDRELRPLAAVSDEDVRNFYYTDPSFQARRKEQKLVLSYTLEQLLLPSAELSELASKRLKAGEDFDTVASDLSARGAESSKLGTISEENMNSRIKEAVQGLKVGESTKPISTGGGYMILRILEVGAPKDTTFEREKERIRGMIFQKRLLDQLKVWLERQKVESYIHVSENSK